MYIVIGEHVSNNQFDSWLILLRRTQVCPSHLHRKIYENGLRVLTFVVMPTAGRAVKLPTLLEGELEALVTWLDLSGDDRKDYGIVKEKLTTVMVSTTFSTLEQFHQRRLVPVKRCLFSFTN